MIVEVSEHSTRWELFKILRRWMPWVLLAFMAAMSQLFLWGFFVAYQNNDIISESYIGYSVENEDGEHEFIEFSCDDILDDRKLDSQLVRLPEDQRADARSFIESSRDDMHPTSRRPGPVKRLVTRDLRAAVQPVQRPRLSFGPLQCSHS